MVAWTGFGATFAITRAITHWVRAGHGPSGGGMSGGGRHLHHYNIGILLLAAVGAVALRGEERHRRHGLTATAYGRRRRADRRRTGPADRPGRRVLGQRRTPQRRRRHRPDRRGRALPGRGPVLARRRPGTPAHPGLTARMIEVSAVLPGNVQCSRGTRRWWVSDSRSKSRPSRSSVASTTASRPTCAPTPTSTGITPSPSRTLAGVGGRCAPRAVVEV